MTRQEKIRRWFQLGASPRATIYLALAARAHAFLNGRGYVTPQDVKSIGYDGPFGIESSYPAFRQLDVDEAAARAFDATMKFF